MKRILCFLLLGHMTGLVMAGNDSLNNEITICWDVSFSMSARDIQKDFEVIDSIITTQNIQKVQLLLFSNSVQEKTFDIIDNNWKRLKDELSTAVYDGQTLYENLNKVSKSGRVYVFTDGKKINNDDFLSLDEGDVIINSSKVADIKFLNLMTFLNKSVFIDKTAGEGKEFSERPEGNQVKGTVYLDGKPLSNVLINSSNGNAVITNKDGKFSYRGSIGDTLRVKGGQTDNRQMIVRAYDQELQFFLDSKIIALDEVVVTEQEKEQLEKVNLGYTTIERKKAGFAVYDIPEERISEVETTVTDVLQEVPGLIISSNSPIQDGSRSGGLSAARIRGRGSINFDPKVLVVIDGIPVQKSTTDSNAGSAISRNADYSFINPQNIKSIQVLKGLAATNLFGTEGAGGVIMITTKSGSRGTGSSKPVDQALLTNNIFEGKLVTKKGQLNTPYLKELKKSKNLKEAYQKYLSQRESYKKDFWYFIDIADYFKTANPELGDRVLSNIMELNFGYEAQRNLFLKYCTSKQNEMALSVAKRMAQDFPNKIQSHYDLAIAQKNAGNTQIAIELLNGIVTGAINPTLNFSSLNKVAGAELRNLVNKYRGQLDLAKINSDYLNNLTYNARLVFEWENPQNEFNLKFVNPQNRYFDWEHSSLADKKRITDELKNGFSIEQFELVGDISIGEWQVNVTNLSSSTKKEPYWLKCKVQYNFGKANQRSEEHLIRLDSSDEKEQLFFKLKVE